MICASALTPTLAAEIADPKHDEDDEGGVIPRPSRKVAQPPGGNSSIQFAEYEHTDALSMAPPHPRSKEGQAAAAAQKDGQDEEGEVTLTHTERFETGVFQPSGEAFKPTRKVRESECLEVALGSTCHAHLVGLSDPGGKSTLGSTLFGGDD